jgi:hypothetical protein
LSPLPGPRLSRAEALARLHRSRRSVAAEADEWTCPVGPLTIRLPNFSWRRRAIDVHDLHHLMTGYPMTMRGEFQMAAWELGAGRYADWRATLFCAPLLLAGLFWSPSRMRAAYKAGRRTVSLYRELAAPAD